ncbi:hypothetical protein [Alteromonas flava]|uniref:hypothetical protein n=1 Tax=Alteromonas flava TaxID=2048003 RepID=UPI000C28B6A3|nr:hypothetical protein [Alteromonas flava]
MEDTIQAQLDALIHDARKPLNRLAMQAELIKMALNDEIPRDKALVALDNIISGSKDSSACLSEISRLIATRLSSNG